MCFEIILTVVTGDILLFVLTLLTLLARYFCSEFFLIDKKYYNEIKASFLDDRFMVLNLFLYVLSLNNKVLYVKNPHDNNSKCKIKLNMNNTVSIYPKNIKYIKQDIIAYTVQINNYELYFLPNIILVNDGNSFLGIDYDEIKCTFKISKYFLDNPPEDSIIVDYRWIHVNKNGTADRRYTNNYQVALCAIGELNCSNDNGLDITFQFSNARTSVNLSAFYDVLKDTESFVDGEKSQIINQMINAVINGKCCPICGEDKIENMKCSKCGYKIVNYYKMFKANTIQAKTGMSILNSMLIFILLCISISFHNSYSKMQDRNLASVPTTSIQKQKKEDVKSSKQVQILTDDKNSVEYCYRNLYKPIEKEFKQNIRQGEYNDDRFYSFQQKYIKIIEKMNENEVDMSSNTHTAWIEKTLSEGQLYFEPNWNYLAQQYGQYLSPTYSLWLKHLAKTQTIVDDACLSVNIDEVRKYILELEQLIKSSDKNFIAKQEMEEQLQWYLRIYLIGLDNSRIFDYDTKIMYDDYRQSYEKFLQENQKSAFYPLVYEFYKKAESYNFKSNDSFDDWRLGEFSNKYFNY